MSIDHSASSTVMLSVFMLNVAFYYHADYHYNECCYPECRFAECIYAEFRVLFIVTVSVVIVFNAASCYAKCRGAPGFVL
jgi:hypothetical protein